MAALHTLSPDTEFSLDNDPGQPGWPLRIIMRETRSWKGERHARGLKVRGQRTKTTARKGRSVGVSRQRVRQG